MIVAVLIRHVHREVRPVACAIVTEQEAINAVLEKGFPKIETAQQHEQFLVRVRDHMKAALDDYKVEFLKDFPEFRDAKFYVDTLETNDPVVMPT